jgi:MFS family permease
MHGRVLALQSALLIGTTPVGGPLLGALADAWGARVPVFVGAAAALGAAALGWHYCTEEREGNDDLAAVEPEAQLTVDEAG